MATGTAGRSEAGEKLAVRACEIAASGAAAYLRKVGAVVNNRDALADLVKESVAASWSSAVQDMLDAFRARMFEVGEQTFAASMVLAGVGAAKAAIAGGVARVA